MKAFILDRYGSNDVVRAGEMPDPELHLRDGPVHVTEERAWQEDGHPMRQFLLTFPEETTEWNGHRLYRWARYIVSKDQGYGLPEPGESARRFPWAILLVSCLLLGIAAYLQWRRSIVSHLDSTTGSCRKFHADMSKVP